MLAVFPPGIDGTLLIPVLVGLLIMAATTEWWGWDFVGVVVPGYLCSVLLLQPVVAGVVLTEALLTWSLVRGLDALASRSGFAYPVFGRDRFFAMLAASIAVRVVLEGFAIQALATLAQDRWPLLAVHRSELFGIGVVLVPLTANRLWRSGPVTGLFQLGVQTGVVWLVVGVVLARSTNFSLGGFELAYDHLALSFLSSPRTQIVLLVTSAFASGLNRRYGWDFHGILVPALLGLGLITPVKLLSTVAEAVLIVVVARGIVALPFLRNVNLEGTRKLVLCFALGFTAKLALASLLAAHYPGYRASDFFGMGYLLPSLVAERIWVKSNLPLVLLPTLQTTVVGTAAAAGLVLALSRLVPPTPPAEPEPFERYQTLPQAVAALGPLVRRGTADPGLLLARVRRQQASATTADGYHLYFREGRAGLLALRDAGGPVLMGGSAEWDAESAATEAALEGASLILGPNVDLVTPAARALGDARKATAPAPAPPPLPQSDEEARTLALEPRGPPVFVGTPPPTRALAEAAYRIGQHRTAPARLAEALRPLGLRLLHAREGVLLVEGAGWPTVVLAEKANAVVAAAHREEWGTPAAALFAAGQLGADCVLPPKEGSTDPVPLALALAEQHRQPLLLVRGRAEGGTDALLLQRPEASAVAAWLQPLTQALESRFTVAHAATGEEAQFQAFPHGAGRVSPVAILWLSADARRAFTGTGPGLARPEVLALAARRGIPVQHGDMARWLSEGHGTPGEPALEAAERLARTRDVAMLRPTVGGARLLLFVDSARGLEAVALEARDRRGLVLSGERREIRVAVQRPEDAAAAFAAGARTLTSGGPP